MERLIQGDCLDKLKELEDESVDLIVTDPPYQLSQIKDVVNFAKASNWKRTKKEKKARKGFMGKEWDILPKVEVWKECLRTLKSGAFAFVMTTPRQDSLGQIISDLREAGFNMGFSSIYWAYASGFPKAQNIGKAVDKRNGRVADEYKVLGEHLRRMRGDRPQKDTT